MVILKYNIIKIPQKLKKIKGQIYKGNLGFYKNTKGIMGTFGENSLNLNPFPHILPNFGENETLGFGGNRED